jgi:MFS family permease
MSETVSRASFAEFRHGWPIVLCASVGIGLGLSPLPFYTIGVFVQPLSDQFGWTVGQILTGLAVMTLTLSLASPAVGYLGDRFGARPIVLTSTILFSLAFALFAAGTGSIWQFYATWVLVALCGAGTLPIIWTRAVNQAFDRRKGLALGLALIGTGVFGPVAKLVADAVTVEAGWRVAYLSVALLPLVIVIPITLFLFKPPGDWDPVTKRQAAPEETRADRPGRSLLSWRFWLLAFAFLPISMVIMGLVPNLETLLGAQGFDRRQAVQIAAAAGPAVVIGRLAGGWLVDRFWAPAVAFVILCLPAISLLVLAHGDPSLTTVTAAVVLIGFAAGVEYDLLSFLVARYFRFNDYGKIYGGLFGFFAVGSGVGPLIFAAAYDRYGNYGPALTVAAVVLLMACSSLLFLGRYGSIERAT